MLFQGGIAIERVEGPQIREIAPEVTPRAMLGAYTAGDGQAHPGRVARALAKACAALGVTTHFGTPARPIFRDGRIEGLALEDGTVIAAGTTVVCTLTGNGLKDPDIVMKKGLAGLIQVPAERSAVEKCLTERMR